MYLQVIWGSLIVGLGVRLFGFFKGSDSTLFRVGSNIIWCGIYEGWAPVDVLFR